MTSHNIKYGFGYIVWCDFPSEDQAVPPEFYNQHPAIIVSTDNKLSLPFLVVPMSTKAQRNNDPAVLKWDPSPIDQNQTSWVVASHVYAVSADRLSPIYRKRKLLRLTKDQIEELKEALSKRLPLEPD